MKYNARNTPNVGYFSDDFRDTVKGNNFKHREKGYVNGAVGNEEFVKEIMTGRIPHPQLLTLINMLGQTLQCRLLIMLRLHDTLRSLG